MRRVGPGSRAAPRGRRHGARTRATPARAGRALSPLHPRLRRARGPRLSQPPSRAPARCASCRNRRCRQAAGRHLRRPRHAEQLRASPSSLERPTNGNGDAGISAPGRWTRPFATRRQRPARAQVEHGVLREHLPLEPAEEGAWIDSELRQRRLGAAVGGEGVDLPPGAVQREHQLSPKPLAMRVLCHEPLELGNRAHRGVPARGQLRFAPRAR